MKQTTLGILEDMLRMLEQWENYDPLEELLNPKPASFRDVDTSRCAVSACIMVTHEGGWNYIEAPTGNLGTL